MSLKHKIPIALILSRLVIGFVLIVLSLMDITHFKWIALTLISFGLLSDIFDGIIARKLNISNQKLRRLDSSVDQVFFICTAIAAYLHCPAFFSDNFLKIGILLGFEALCYIVSFVKFRKEIATHSIGAKIWTLFLFATLVQVIAQCRSGIVFELCFWIGLVSRAEIIAIILVLKKWTNDVPSIVHAFQLRKDKPIKRNKLLNG